MELTDKITIRCTPRDIRDALIFFFQSTENYRKWHQDHISCYWKKGRDLEPGSVLVATEYIHGRKHTLGFRICDTNGDELLEYRMLFPFSIICRGGSFSMIANDEGTEFTAKLNFRSGSLIRKLFNRQIEALKIHMKEEGQSLKEFIEKETPHKT